MYREVSRIKKGCPENSWRERELEETEIDKERFMFVSWIAVIGIKSREGGRGHEWDIQYLLFTWFDWRLGYTVSISSQHLQFPIRQHSIPIARQATSVNSHRPRRQLLMDGSKLKTPTDQLNWAANQSISLIQPQRPTVTFGLQISQQILIRTRHDLWPSCAWGVTQERTTGTWTALHDRQDILIIIVTAGFLLWNKSSRGKAVPLIRCFLVDEFGDNVIQPSTAHFRCRLIWAGATITYWLFTIHKAQQMSEISQDCTKSCVLTVKRRVGLSDKHV